MCEPQMVSALIDCLVPNIHIGASRGPRQSLSKNEATQ